MITNQKRLNDLENHIREFHEESKLKKEEVQEELDKAVEEELLLVEVENLRLGIYQVFLSLEIGSSHGFETGKISVEDIIENIKDLKRSLLKEEDEKQRVLIENAVILTVLEEIQLGYRESELHKTALMNRYETVKDDFLRVKKQNLDLIEVNGNLGLELDMLHEELEERKNIEQNLTSELQERENEFELWDAEATSFIFDLSNIEHSLILYETKVHQLAGSL
ncbi:hypothetical protein HanPSC8_Chr04g0176791 [Helianthus annuus]|nr:hypothetical protein HanPSC8_Chr04g0176791 [Helianthus annuus]